MAQDRKTAGVAMDSSVYPPAQPGSGTQPRVILDTDAFNEIDDQFALAYLLRSANRVSAEAIYAAPFSNQRSSSAGDGMQKSFEEIARLLERLHESETPSFRGSENFLTEAGEPASGDKPASAAVADLINRAMTATHSDRLNIIAIGALTNVASALLVEPEIVERCTVIWLGGHHPNWPDNREFNLQGDIVATRAVFDSGVPLYVVPCRGVASHLLTSAPELEKFLDLADPLSRFLYDRYIEYGPDAGVWTKEIWDIAAVAWLVLPGAVKSYPLATPRIAADGSYIHDPRRPPCRFAYQLDRDAIFADLFERLRLS
jgi:inosine-uridine nucleoside N-ribohydrolase